MITITQTYAGNFIIPPEIQNRRSQGIPPGGPADPFLSKIALHLAQTETCLEITSPITLSSPKPSQIILISPQNSRVLAHHPTTSFALIPLLPNQPLTIQSPQTGYRLYLAWPGLQSPSRFPNPITTNTQFSTIHSSNPQFLSLSPPKINPSTSIIHYIPNPEFEKADLHEIPCQATPNISRIGTRVVLQPTTLPEPVPAKAGREGLREGQSENYLSNYIHRLANQTLPRSEPSIHGAIQVTPDQQLLIHGPDGPTLGGYPKLGVIIQAELPTLAQLRPNQQITLIPTTLEAAHIARQKYQSNLVETLTQIDRALRIARS